MCKSAGCAKCDTVIPEASGRAAEIKKSPQQQKQQQHHQEQHRKTPFPHSHIQSTMSTLLPSHPWMQPTSPTLHEAITSFAIGPARNCQKGPQARLSSVYPALATRPLVHSSHSFDNDNVSQ